MLKVINIYKLSIIKISHGDIMYTVWVIGVNNTVLHLKVAKNVDIKSSHDKENFKYVWW